MAGNDRYIGRMRHRLAVQSRTVTQDVFGAAVESWATEATRWAEVVETGGSSPFQAQAVRPGVTHLVSLRYYDGLTPRHRFLHEGRVLQIDSVTNPDGQKRFHEVHCVEEVA